MKRFVDQKKIVPITGPIGIYAPVDFLQPHSPRFLLELASARNQCRFRDVAGRSKARRDCAARKEAIKLIDAHCGLSYADIGRAVRRHHTTVLYALGRLGTCAG